MPQFDFAHNYWLGQLVWLAVLFVFFLLAVRYIVLPSVRRSVGIRERKRALLLRQATRAEKETQEITAMHREVSRRYAEELKKLRREADVSLSKKMDDLRRRYHLRMEQLKKEHAVDFRRFESKLESHWGEYIHELNQAFLGEIKKFKKS